MARSSSSPTLAAAKTVALYALVALAWIFLSDRALFALGLPPETAEKYSTFKGILFVVVTCGLMFWRLRSDLEVRRRHEEQLRLFIEHAPVALAMLDRDLCYVTVSQRWREAYGLGHENLRGRRHYDFLPQLPEHWRLAHQRALAGETLREEADRVEHPDGTVSWRRWEIQPWHQPTGEIGGITLFTEDITARKTAEAALADSRARLRLALKCGHVGTWNWDAATGKLEHDENVGRLCGRSAEEFARGGESFFYQCIHPDDRASVEEKAGAALREGTDFVAEYRMLHPDGSVIWFADRASVECDSTGRPQRMVGACVDITALKRMERALHDSEDRLHEVVETIQEVFWITDAPKTRLLYLSPGYEKIWGRPCADAYASPLSWLDGVHPEDRERVRQAALEKQAAGTYKETYRVVRPDGSIRWVRDHAYPVRDATGTVARIVGAAEDITERKELEEQFLHAQRIEAIGTLASGVAHDMNNILAPLVMVAPLLRSKLTDPRDGELLNIVELSAQRGAEVVRQLLTFSRGVAGERGPLQLRHLVKEMAAIMRETFPREIGINPQVPGDLWPVVGDTTQLHQVLLNLCVNARDAMPRGGKLTLEGRNVILAEPEVRPHTGVQPGRFVVLTVTDTGDGIPPESRARIFDPFFTTKPQGKGTGLGLSTVQGIVKSHGGFITLESEVGRGTSFHIHIPSSEAASPTTKTTPPLTPSIGRGEWILVVDDEPGVRIATRTVLERHGYRTLLAADGREGLGIFLAQRSQIRAVVTDLMMPEMGGIALVRALRDLNATIPILAATGLQESEKAAALSGLGVNVILPKPYAPAELIEALKAELAKAHPAS